MLPAYGKFDPSQVSRAIIIMIFREKEYQISESMFS